MQTSGRWATRIPAFIAGLATGLLVAGLACAVLILDGTPDLPPAPAATAQELSEGHRLLRRHDPRRARPGALYVVRLSGPELTLLSAHLGRMLGGAATLALKEHRLDLHASIPVPHLPLWLNVQASLADGPGLPRFEQLRLGSLSLSAPLAQGLARQLLAWLEGPTDGPPLHRMVRQFTIWPHQVHLVYQWRADAPAMLLARLIPAEQLERLRVYNERLAQIVGRGSGPVELTELMAGLAQLASDRSADDAAAAEENRAWLRALALYVNGQSMASMWPGAQGWPRPRPRAVMLLGRDDFPQHFVVSALLAMEAGGPFADALGLAKEVEDSRFGSGFSFTDVAANRAGQKFGSFASNSPRQLQRGLTAGAGSRALMPDVSDLAEFMQEPQFLARFGGVGAPAYQAALALIDQRVAALALYR